MAYGSISNGALLEGVELPRDGCLHDLLDAEARSPERLLLRPVGERDWTVRDVAQKARACALALQRRGVGPGDRVAIMSRNSALMVAWWYGIYMLGAVEVQVNANLRGPFLRHVLSDADPSLVIAQREVRDAIDALDLQVEVLHLEREFPAEGLTDFDIVMPRGRDLATLMYTSGTTGPSKGVMLSFEYWSNYGAIVSRVCELAEDQVFFVPLPFFHVDSHTLMAGCLQSGAVLAFPGHFSASRFWEQTAATGATLFVAVGALLSAIIAHGPPPESSSVLVKRILGSPVPAGAYEFFEDGLGMEIFELYGQTEADCPVYSTPRRRRRGAAGWPCAGSAVAIIDDDGRPLPPGERGEIVYRPNYPGLLTLGYWKRPEATIDAARDLWWHSGDVGHFDDDGFLYFDGRLKDYLRYRGENVSAWELEETLRQAPGIMDAAAVAQVDSLGGEDIIKVFVVLDSGAAFDPGSLFRFCEENLPRFAVPRVIEPIEENGLIRSPGTTVIQKHRLPAENGPLAVDRDRWSEQ